MVEVVLLGPPQVSVDGTPIEVDTRKAIALLAYLVVEKSATRDALAGLFWADSSQERARATLRRTLSALRSATGDLIEADRNQVSLAGTARSDLEELDRELRATTEHDHHRRDVCPRCIPHLRRATDLYRGDFLQGFSAKASPEFDDWVRSVAESTRIRVGEAYNRLGTALAAEGDYPGAISAVARWIDLDPLHEPAHRLLMLLHAWAGDRPGAIEAYRSCVATFDQELGVPPLEETTELYEAILDEDLPPAPGVRRRVKAEAPPRRQAPTDLIDREAELQGMRDALSDATGGPGLVLAVTGPPWMGKTRLLDELVAERPGQETWIGRAFRMEQALPYGVATQVLRSAAARIEEHRAEIPDWALAEIERLLPELGAGPGDTMPDRFGELRLLEAIHVVTAVIAAKRPLLVVLDDVQWMDPASAAVFSYIGRRIGALPMLLIVAARTGDELIPPTAELVGNADRAISIGALAVEHLAPLLEGDDAAARHIQAQTGGVPLLVAEALVAGGEGAAATPGMSRYMEARMLETGDLGRQILTAAAVLNGVCDAGLLRETSGRTEEEVVEAVEELVGAGLLREMPESDGLSFALDALERATYDSTSLVRRRLLHRRAAQALEERSHSRTDARLAAAVAAQYQAAGDPAAAGWYRLAGDLARAVYANESAQQFYEAALALGEPDPSALHLALGELAMTTGDYHRARQELTVAASRAGAGSIGLIEHRTGEVERLLGRFEAAEGHFERSLEDHPAPASVLADWALLAHRTGEAGKARDLAARAQTAAEDDGESQLESRVRNILAVVSTDRDEAIGHIEEAIRLAGDDDLLRMAALNNKAMLLADNGETDRSIELVLEAIAIAERTGHRHREAALWNHLADLQHQAGRDDDSRGSLTKAVSLFADIDSGELEPELWLLSRW